MISKTDYESLDADMHYKQPEDIRRAAYDKKLALLAQEREEREPDKEIPAWADPLLRIFYKDHSYHVFETKIGQFFLFQELTNSNGVDYMSRPKLGLFIETDIYDQAGVFRYVEPGRTWESNRLKHSKKAQIEEVICWDTSVYVFGTWWGKPSFEDLLQAYRKTFYYGKPERVNIINGILHNL